MIKKVRKMFDTEGGLSLLGYVLSFHAVALGLSFALDTADAKRTLLYQTLSSFPVIEPVFFGWVLAISGLFAFLGYALRRSRASRHFVKYASSMQFVVYLFMTFLYLFSGLYWYAASVAVPWVPLVYIVSTAYCNLPRHKSMEELRAEWGLPSKK